MGAAQALSGAIVYSGKAEALGNCGNNEESTHVLCIVSLIHLCNLCDIMTLCANASACVVRLNTNVNLVFGG